MAQTIRAVHISFLQLLDLQKSGKSIFVVVFGSWQARFEAAAINNCQPLSRGIRTIFVLSVDSGSVEEDYFIDVVRLKSLPSLLEIVQGRLVQFRELQQYQNNFNQQSAMWSIQRFTLSVGNSVRQLMSTGRLFLSGDRSSVGKSSMCLAILTSLLRRGVDPKSLAYIKPATQCEAEQPITRFCNRVGIANRAIGPVVFFKGFTRAFLDGEVGTAESLLNDIEQAVADLSRGRSFVLIDGVGYPAVGSICDLSNADVARKLQAPVLFIGKSGVGDAVDSYNLNSVFFEHHGVHVLGGIFNKLPLEGYYSLEACKTAVTQYFVQRKPQELPYGFMPLLDITATEDDEPDISDNITGSNVSSADTDSEDEMEVEVRQAEAGTKTKPRGERVALTAYERQLSDAFMRHVDIDRLMNDVWLHQVYTMCLQSCSSGLPLTD